MSKLVLIDFGGILRGPSRQLESGLVTRFGREVECGPRLDVPLGGFHRERAQYEAGSFLARLRTLANESDAKYLGLTDVDLFSRGLNFVFGQADINGAAAVISLARLHPERSNGGSYPELLRERVLKEAVHELGHTFGLGHCRNNRCVMFFSRDLPDTDVKGPDFCARHAADLAAPETRTSASRPGGIDLRPGA